MGSRGEIEVNGINIRIGQILVTDKENGSWISVFSQLFLNRRCLFIMDFNYKNIYINEILC